MLDTKQLAESMVTGAKAYVDKVFSGVSERLAALEGRKMEKGERGVDGVGVSDIIRDADGTLIAVLSDGRTKAIGNIAVKDGAPGADGTPGVDGKSGVDGKDGQDGTNGVDGLGFDDLSVVHDGERGFTFRFARGEHVKEFTFALPVVIDRGVYSTEKDYAPGDGVSFGGSFWIAQNQTKDRPETSKSWRLAVKRGRDGKDGSAGAPGERGLQGNPGRDLTQMGPGGEKW